MNKIFLTLISLTLLLSGCYNRRELNDLAIAVGLAIDFEDDKYKVMTQVVDPATAATRRGSSGTSPVINYKSEAKSIFEAVRKMTTVSPRKIYFSHVRIIVIGEELARKEGIGKVLELITRDPEFRSDFHVIVAKEAKASDVLSVLTPLEKMSAQKLFNSLQVSEKAWAPTHATEFDSLISDMLSYGKSPVITGVIVKGDEEKGEKMKNIEQSDPSAKLIFKGLGVIKGDKLVGWLNVNESKGYNYIVGEVKNTVGPIDCPKKGKVVIEVYNAESNMKGKFVKGKPKIYIDLSYEANIGEVLCKNLNLTDPEHIKILEKKTEERNKFLLRKSIKKAKEMGADIFGFGNVLWRSDPKKWHEIEKEWNEKGFKEVEVVINSKCKIRRTGTTSESYLKDIKE